MVPVLGGKHGGPYDASADISNITISRDLTTDPSHSDYLARVKGVVVRITWSKRGGCNADIERISGAKLSMSCFGKGLPVRRFGMR